MTEKILDEPAQEHIEVTPVEARAGFRGVHVLAILAISTFLASIALITFFVSGTMAH